jgi:hypothetical protein
MRIWLVLVLCLHALAYGGLTAKNSELSDEIPPLKPPRGEIPAGFWEQNRLLVTAAAVATLCVAALTIRFLARKKQSEPIPPEIEARTALEAFHGKTENGHTISEISRVVRRYFVAAFDLPQQELTTAEFARVTLASESIGADLAERVGKFLRDCDQRKFALESAPQPPSVLAAATSLIDLGEERREYLRKQEEQKQKAVSHARQS